MNRIGAALEGCRPVDFCFLGGYALYLAFGYMAFESATILSSGGDVGNGAVPLFIVASLVGRLFVFAIGIFVSMRFPSIGPIGSIAVSMALGSVGFMVVAMALQVAEMAPYGIIMPWLALSGALLGGGAASGALVWARFVSTLGTRSAYLYVVLSNLTSLPVYFFITLLPSIVHVPLCCLLLILSMLSAKPCITMRGTCVPVLSKDAAKGVAGQLWRPVLGACVLAFMSGFMLQVAQRNPIPLDVFQGTSLVTQFVVMAALLAPALLVKRPIALASVYKVALSLSVMGFLLLPVIWTNVGGIANACAQLGFLVASVILWCMLSDSVRESQLPSDLVFSIALCVISVAQLGGALLGYLGGDWLAPGHVLVTAVALASIYAATMVSMFLFKDRSFKTRGGLGAEVDCADGSSSADDIVATCGKSDGLADYRSGMSIRCDAVADKEGLTPREHEVLSYLVRGCTISTIAKELVVSENTVKFHVKGIYQKLGVHSRAEVMEVVEKTGVQ